MKRVVLPLMFLALAACQETTSPEQRLAPGAPVKDVGPACCSDAPEVPPPPQVDTMSVSGNQFIGFATVNVGYLLSKTENNGFLRFTGQEFGAVATPNARVSSHKGVFSGRGILYLQNGYIDLSSVTQASRFSDGPDYFHLTFARSYQVIGGETVFAGPAYSRVGACPKVGAEGDNGQYRHCFVGPEEGTGGVVLR